MVHSCSVKSMNKLTLQNGPQLFSEVEIESFFDLEQTDCDGGCVCVVLAHLRFAVNAALLNVCNVSTT